MDEIVGAIVEQIAKNAREAAKRRAAAMPVRSQIAAGIAAAPAQQPAPVRVPPVAQPAAPTSPLAVDDGLLGPSAILGGDSPFGGLLMPGDPIPLAKPDTLLGAFTGGAGFLGAFVLSEALAPPLALREPRRS